MTHDLFTKSLQQVTLVGTAVCGGDVSLFPSVAPRSPARWVSEGPDRVSALPAPAGLQAKVGVGEAQKEGGTRGGRHGWDTERGRRVAPCSISSVQFVVLSATSRHPPKSLSPAPAPLVGYKNRYVHLRKARGPGRRETPGRRARGRRALRTSPRSRTRATGARRLRRRRHSTCASSAAA